MWEHMSITPALGRERQEGFNKAYEHPGLNGEFQANKGYTARLCLKVSKANQPKKEYRSLLDGSGVALLWSRLAQASQKCKKSTFFLNQAAYLPT